MKVAIIAGLAVLLNLGTGAASAASADNALTWRVADEKGVFGYIVYRGERREGPFRRVSASVIRRHRDAGQAPYRFDDRSVEAGKTYYYFIDVISELGRKQRLSGVRSKTVTKAVP